MVVVNDLRKGLGITEWVKHYYNALSRMDGIKISIIVESGRIEVPEGYFDSNIKIIPFHHMIKQPLRYIIDWLSVKKKLEEYDFIHFHTDNLTKFFPLVLLRKNSNVIIHSHNSMNIRVEQSPFRLFLHSIGKMIVRRSDFTRFACSSLAAEWLFDNEPFILIRNGIDLDSYKFDTDKRKNIRKKYNLGNSVVVGHIGRFSDQKNHEKLISIFSEICRYRNDVILILIGTGILEERIRQLVEERQLTDKVLFLGYQANVAGLLNAIDLVIFPSKYEGLPIALVEAQANGIPVFFSDKIASDVNLLPASGSFKLSSSSHIIAESILKRMPVISKSGRDQAELILKRNGYSDEDVLKQLYDFYVNN